MESLEKEKEAMQADGKAAVSKGEKEKEGEDKTSLNIPPSLIPSLIFSTYTISSCYEPPTCPPPHGDQERSLSARGKQIPCHFLQGAIGCIHLHMGGLVLHQEKHFPSAGVNSQVPP